MKIKKTLASLVFAGAMALGAGTSKATTMESCPCPNTQAWYFNNFENLCDPLSEWSKTYTDTTPGTAKHPADRFLGQFYNGTVSLTLNNLPPHKEITTSFDLYVLRTWDGNDGDGDIWSLDILNGPSLLRTTFSNHDFYPQRQAFPDQYPGGDNDPRTGAAENNTLGFTYDPHGVIDSVYNLTFTFPHSENILTMNFAASNLEYGTGDESWGLDNVEVVPEPATLALLGAGLAGLLARRKRKK